MGFRLGTALGIVAILSACSRGTPSMENAVVSKGAYSAFYDDKGRLARIERDTNGDGRPDQVAYYDGESSPRRLEVDEDFDGKPDRWEYYGADGALVKVGRSRHHGGKADVWTYPGPDGRTRRVELDTDGDGRVDRWQDWSAGRLASEDLDTDGDGKPDRRILYDRQGRFSCASPSRSMAPSSFMGGTLHHQQYPSRRPGARLTTTGECSGSCGRSCPDRSAF